MRTASKLSIWANHTPSVLRMVLQTLASTDFDSPPRAENRSLHRYRRRQEQQKRPTLSLLHVGIFIFILSFTYSASGSTDHSPFPATFSRPQECVPDDRSHPMHASFLIRTIPLAASRGVGGHSFTEQDWRSSFIKSALQVHLIIPDALVLASEGALIGACVGAVIVATSNRMR